MSLCELPIWPCRFPGELISPQSRTGSFNQSGWEGPLQPLAFKGACLLCLCTVFALSIPKHVQAWLLLHTQHVALQAEKQSVGFHFSPSAIRDFGNYS